MLVFVLLSLQSVVKQIFDGYQSTYQTPDKIGNISTGKENSWETILLTEKINKITIILGKCFLFRGCFIVLLLIIHCKI